MNYNLCWESFSNPAFYINFNFAFLIFIFRPEIFVTWEELDKAILISNYLIEQE